MPTRKRQGKVRRVRPPKPPAGPGGGNLPPREVSSPDFAQPEATQDPSTFRVKHLSDKEAYRAIDQLNREHKIVPLKFQAPRGGVEPRLTLIDVLGGRAEVIRTIEKNQQIVFHATGDCGSVKGPQSQNLVTDKMISDFATDKMVSDSDQQPPADSPRFALLLGDIVYSFGEPQYYYDQFYEPYREYPAPVLAAAGNHDGMVSPLAGAQSLAAYMRNFCDDTFERTGKFTVSPDAGGLSRTAQIQPGVFFTFEAPFLRILVLYSNTLEDPGVISNPDIGRSQLDYLDAALRRVKSDKFQGALLIADHHPPYTAGGRHGGSPEMLRQIDDICGRVGVWPHAFLSGHAHNYQRFTRTRPDGTQIPYLVCGNGGHNYMPLVRNGPAIRTPQVIQAAQPGSDLVVLENYDDQDYGYLRLVVTATQLRIEYHPASDGAASKTPDDFVTVDLADRKLAHFSARDLGWVARAQDIRSKRVD